MFRSKNCWPLCFWSVRYQKAPSKKLSKQSILHFFHAFLGRKSKFAYFDRKQFKVCFLRDIVGFDQQFYSQSIFNKAFLCFVLELQRERSLGTTPRSTVHWGKLETHGGSSTTLWNTSSPEIRNSNVYSVSVALLKNKLLTVFIVIFNSFYLS